MTNFLLFTLSVLTALSPQQDVAGQELSRATLRFEISPVKQIFSKGEDVILVFAICNNSEDPALVSRNAYDEFIDLGIKGPEGEVVDRRGKRQIDSKSYHPDDFTVLKKGECTRSKASVSLKNGVGFEIKKPGRYSVVGEYSMGPEEYFAPIAGTAKVPTGSFRAKPAIFCVGVCTKPST
jgi:hypothetical protein